MSAFSLLQIFLNVCYVVILTDLNKQKRMTQILEVTVTVLFLISEELDVMKKDLQDM